MPRARPRARVTALAVLALVVSLLAGGTAVGQGDAAAPSPPYQDLHRALADLNETRTQLARLEMHQLDMTEQQHDLADARADLAANEQNYNALIVKAMRDARQLAVAAYTTGGLGAVDYVADARSAGDLQWRRNMLETQSGLVTEAASSFVELRAAATATQLALAEEEDALARRVRAAERDAGRLAARIHDQEFVVSIAEINNRAAALYSRTQRDQPTEEQWAELRRCESNDRYDIDTGNGFYGAYQFTLETWRGVGGFGSPAVASAQEQDARARVLHAMRGAQPWPLCGRYLP